MGGRKYFYSLLKPLADISEIEKTDLMDWGQDHQYNQAIGVGECAGVILDVIGTIINDATEKLQLAKSRLQNSSFSDSIYYAYSAFVIGAKASLLSQDIKCNTQRRIISDFQKEIVETEILPLPYNFERMVLSINQNEPQLEFATVFLEEATKFLEKVIQLRATQVSTEPEEKQVITSYYNA